MANSVVKVTDAMLNDSLLLLVGEDGTVTPDRETVETYLSSKTGATNIQIMHINKNDGKGIDVSIDNLTYLPDADTEDILVKELNMDEVSRNLYNFKLDHDYTPLTSPRRSPIPEEDELAKTLSILDGGEEVEPKKVTVERTLIPVLTPIKNTAVVSQVVNKIEKKVESKDNKNENISTVEPEVKTPVSTKAQRRSKFISSSKPKPKPKNIEEELEENSEDEDFDIEFEDDENDSDFDMEEEIKPKLKRGKRTKSESSKMLPKSHKETPKQHKPELPKEKPQEKPLEVKPPDTPTDKKPPKKEKKTPKPIPDDFALFSTPDIIRRVGGKEPTTPEASPTKPAKITQESRSKSTSDGSHSPTKHGRVSFDGKLSTSKDIKLKDRRPSSEVKKRTSIDEKPKKIEVKPTELMEVVNSNDHSLQQVPLVIPPEEHQSHIPMEDFGTVVPPVEGDNINLDGTGLELDQSLLDNLNNDLIPEDILYQVAQSLVRNTELQSVIDKGINEGVLNASVQDTMNLDDSVMHNTDESFQESSDISPYKGTQIVRPDGRIVTIPPIERPATRSRNKRSDEERPSLFKPVHKPLDDEHVSGNELDSSGDEEEESEDDPNKLWCICNQPHNNRFMICCDTCEEWYHGKCVNITKAMGQQMESEGKEWICLFCKDPSLRRPQAAARRVRKASRNSRASTDSVDSSKKPDVPGSTGSMPCVVCQKPARKNSIFCSEACILEQAKNVERAVVFDRATGNMLTGNKAPSAANLEQWLKEHPTFEAVKSGGKVVTAKSGNMTQSKLKLVKNTDTEGVSLAIQNKAGVVGVLKHAPKQIVNVKTPTKVSHFKIVSKQVSSTSPAIKTTKLISPISKPTNANVQSVTTTPTTPKVKVIQTTIKTNAKTPQAAKQPVPVKTPKARQQEVQAPQAKKQENIRENVQKTLFEQLTNRLKDVEDIKLSEDEVKSISTEIESQLYRCFGDTGQKYRNKYRSLIFNIKDVKNQTLWRRICEKSINPYELVRLSPDDLASQELAMWREREAKHQLDMIKKSELELLNCNRQYVLKTHKGEQVLEDDRRTDKVDNIEAIKSLTEGSTLSAGEAKQEKDKDTDKKSAKHSHKDKEREREKKLRDHHKKRSSSRDRSRKRSKSRDRKDKKKSRSRDRDRDKHRKSHKSSKHKIEGGPIETSKLDPKSKEILDKLVVNKIVPPLEDRLWRHVPQEDIVPAAESDSDHEPTSTVTIPTPPRSSEQDDEKSSTEKPEKEKPAVEERSMSPPPKKPPAEIWRGTISMIDVAQISITAHEVSGDCQGLGKELNSNLEIVGRISPDTVWDYISKMKCSNSKVISMVRLNATNMEEKMPYLALYSYLSSRTRLGVVKSTNKAVKDFYILPLAPQKPIPQALLPLNGPGFEESRPALLLGIIVRDKRKRPYMDPTSNPLSIIKRSRVETPPLPVPATSSTPPPLMAKTSAAAAAPSRSYTPPPVKDPRLNKLPLPVLTATPNEDDEPYSPGDSDPDTAVPIDVDVSLPAIPGLSDVKSTSPLLSTKYTSTLPGLGSPSPAADPSDIQRQMEELNKKIEMQKSEINSISQNITATASDLGTSSLANIALPSNLQQILDSIKNIEAATPADVSETTVSEAPVVTESPSDLTIPLMIPKIYTKRVQTPPKTVTIDLTSDTIPLVLPTKPKIKPVSVNSPLRDGGSVLSALSEEELIRKANEMLGETSKNPPSAPNVSPPSKKMKLEVSLPPVPGLDD